MSKIGIIAEFNPLHSGHEYLIKEAKKLGTVVCVISGNFVQRGDTAICDKGIRAMSALKAGADVVIELPVLWSMSTAQNFALGGISALMYSGCDTVIFGSECGNIEKLKKTADILLSNEFSQKLKEYQDKNITFAAARQKCAEDLGAPNGILEEPNNNLGLEYIIAAKKLGFNCEFKTISRKGAKHDSLKVDEFVSASLLREKLKENDFEFCKKYINPNILSLLSNDNISDISKIDTAILSVLRTKTKEDFASLPDISEGLENKIFSASRVATNLKMLYNEVKVKRYTEARIRRLVLSAFLGFDNSFFMKPLPYIRILGFSNKGEKFLKENIRNSPVPIISRLADTEKLTADTKKVFEAECRATDLYALSLNNPLPCGLEYKRKIIKLKGDKNVQKNLMYLNGNCSRSLLCGL